ncbi:39S ribosomal protein L46, mitochondrial [Hylaeus anthracinus]|uniref:39S ribosomal protein L46, mitochondrial n=1 Tax=Hylaeus anthracinus TaxID=313031 RepID=UPI0023B961D6|nr:39S ribosomal protein L46, mitochondrial [Hylaeus anthracinus]
MMLKRILTLPTPNSTFFLTPGTSSTSKVILRALSQNTEVVKKWDLMSAVCLERHPIITKPMLDIQVRYQELLRQIEFENSLLSEFELKVEKEKEQKQKASKNDDVNIVYHQTTQDYLDSAEEELQKFTFAPRESEDNGVSSLERKLDKHLMLLTEQNIGNTNFWIPPQSIRKDEETMIETANRTVQEFCGSNVKVKFYGNAPIGFYKYTYPKEIRAKGQEGAKIFYFLAKYISGDISSNVKHCWLDREELKQTVHSDVYKSLSKFLIPD